MFFSKGVRVVKPLELAAKTNEVWEVPKLKRNKFRVSSVVFPCFFVESLFYDFGDWRCLCIPMKGPVEWSVWSVAVSEARSNGVIEQELYHHDERHLENSCNLSTKSQKNGATYETFTVRITLANIAMTSELRNKFHRYFSDPKKHIQNMGSFWDSNSSGIQRGYNPESQTLPWSNFYRDSKGPPPKLVFQLWTETTCWRFSSQIRMDCPMIAPKKDRSCTTKTVGTHLRYIDSIDLSLVGKTFYPSPRQKKQIFVDLPLHHTSA